MPDWYPLIKAAKYLGVAPWELEQQPRAWMSWALSAEAAEIGAQADIQKRARKSGK